MRALTEDAQHEEADDPSDEFRDEIRDADHEIARHVDARMLGQLELDDQQRHRDGEDPVGERFEAVLGQPVTIHECTRSRNESSGYSVTSSTPRLGTGLRMADEAAALPSVLCHRQCSGPDMTDSQDTTGQNSINDAYLARRADFRGCIKTPIGTELQEA
jgi:hypothetical protein